MPIPLRGLWPRLPAGLSRVNIAGYRGDGAFWCPDCATKRYGESQVGELIIVDAAGDQVLPVLDPDPGLHLLASCAGDCGQSIPVPRPRRVPTEF